LPGPTHGTYPAGTAVTKVMRTNTPGDTLFSTSPTYSIMTFTHHYRFDRSGT